MNADIEALDYISPISPPDCNSQSIPINVKSAVTREKERKKAVQLSKRQAPWPAEANERLSQLMLVYKEHHDMWVQIARVISAFWQPVTREECRQHYYKVVCPQYRKGPWKADETQLLHRVYYENPNITVVNIAKIITTRGIWQIRKKMVQFGYTPLGRNSK